MRIFAFRSFRAAAPGLMEFTQQQRYLFICSAQPALPSTSICFSGQDSSFSTINMHFMECNGTHVQSAGKSAAQFCTYAHLRAQGILSSQILVFMRLTGIHEPQWHVIWHIYEYILISIFGLLTFLVCVTTGQVYLWCHSEVQIFKVISLVVSWLLMTQSQRVETGFSFIMAKQEV